jgi:hypothetical protein
MIALLSLLQENPVASDFDELGKLLLVGMAAAVVVAVGIILVRFKLHDRKPPTSNFISISPPNNQGE